jgi:ferritin
LFFQNIEVMDTNRLSKTLTAALNSQMTNEAYASQIYLSYGAWAENQGFGGIVNFLFRHAGEERDHMMKILEYILQRGAKAQITTIPAPHDKPASVKNCFEKIFEIELENTKAIYKLIKMSFDEQDWTTWNFMQYFVKGQIEEETLAMDLLNKMRIAGAEKVNSNAMLR